MTVNWFSPLYYTLLIVLGLSFLWSIWLAAKEAFSRLRRLHQIPCTKCAFYTGDYRLKCTVRPCEALSEAAWNCVDFEPTDYPQINLDKIKPPCQKPVSKKSCPSWI
ncbi:MULTISPECIES: hypothetical protein [Desertifilum]|uniref:Uncharacterized protein n=2 Tax=Desertifilum tharense IPPAS B-1220 TaxID=1781255 RepID=A0A1E5QJ57_9CYAN|nr:MULTISPECIES: hypothetical protein [Desertifilum]MDA0213147.1 hypothetical protein [Cyanobacteria bacterium FC1]MDI9640542.1 hypothetical protein [Geitlerinema splendidum]OEJ74702.1 hypothetical protein BH720_13040 [Desertifilum tharense IPPAS B-1220]